MNHYNREYWEDGTTGYLAYADFPVHWRILQIIMQRKPKSVLMIGDARGYVTRKLNDAGVDATNIDISEHCWYTKADNNFVLHDITKVPWPFKDKEFDLSFSIAVLEHIDEKDLPNVIKEICRVSERALMCPSLDNIKDTDHDVTHKSLHSLQWWVEMFNKHGQKGYEVELMDKEDAEHGTIPVPVPDGKVKLNLGCFIHMLYFGWHNVDIVDLKQFARQYGYIFDQADLSKPDYLDSYPDNSVDCINISHTLEHFDRQTGKRILTQCYNKLRDGGVIRIAVPDTETICKKYLNGTIHDYKAFNIGVEKSEDDAQALYEMLMAGHQTVYDYWSLVRILKKIGYHEVRRYSQGQSMHPNIEKEVIDTYPESSVMVEAKKHIEERKQYIPKTQVAKDAPLDYKRYLVNDLPEGKIQL